MIDITALGEVLIDFTPAGISEAGMRLFEQNPGGAPANVLAAVSKMGLNTAFIGKVGDDMHGVFLRETLESLGVGIEGMISDPACFTTLAFVGLDNGERSFSFARKPGADTQLRPEEIPQDLLENTKLFHFGSLSLTDEPARSATLHAIETAKQAGAIISYDPNYRAPLWPDEETAKQQMRSVIPSADLMKISDEECALMTDDADSVRAADILLEQGVKCVFVTLGGDGALVKTRTVCERMPAFKGEVVDTTGAGDSFWGGVLYQFAVNGRRPDEISAEDAKKILRFANAVAGLCVQKRGAIPAMPSLEEIKALSGWK